VLVDADEEKELKPAPEEITKEPSTLNLQTLSLNLSSFSYWRFSSHHTLKVKGTIQDSEVIVLVDLGAEANSFLPTSSPPRFTTKPDVTILSQGWEWCYRTRSWAAAKMSQLIV